jgi:hypothetical protein
MKSVAFAILLIGSLFASHPCYADLILQIDPGTKTFAFTGTDTGTPFDFLGVGGGGEGLTQWRLVNLGTVAGSSVSYDNDQTFSTSVGTPGNAVVNRDFQLATDASFGGAIGLSFYTSSAATQTFTGLGNFQSYAGLAPADQALFESTVGSTFTINPVFGVGFGSIRVTSASAAVPEPSSALILGFSLGAGVLLRRRRV